MNQSQNSYRSEMESSFELQEDLETDESVRKNLASFKYMGVYNAQLAEKLYIELCSLSFGEYDIDGGQISPVMWTRLHDIFAETENQTRKLPVNVKYSEFSQKYANEAVQIASVMAIFTALPHEYAAHRETSLLAQLILNDIEFRRVFTLLLWSEKAISEQKYEKGLTDQVRKLERVRHVRSSSIISLKRSNFCGPPKNASLDPDASGNDEDIELEKTALNVIFDLVRSGEIAKASEIAVNLGMGPVAAQLQLHAVIRRPEDVPIEANAENLALFKRKRRAEYFEKLQNLIEITNKGNDDCYVKLLHALRGNSKPLLKEAKTVAEKIWSYANTAFLARMLMAEGEMSSENVYSLFNGPLTASSIIEQLETAQSAKNEVLVFFQVVDAMLGDNIEDLFRLARKQVENYVPLDINCGVNIVALSLFYHLTGVALLSGFERNEDADVVIARQFDDLRNRVGSKSHRRMAAFYSKFLPEETKHEQIVTTMKVVDNEEERIIFAEALRQCEMNFSVYACSLIQTIRDADEAKMISTEDQISHWQWLLIGGEETSLAAVEELNRLIRKCLRCAICDEVKIRQMIREAFRFDLAAVLTNAKLENLKIYSLFADDHDPLQEANSTIGNERINHAINEFLAHCTFMDVYNLIVTIAVKLGMAMDYQPIEEEELRIIGGVLKKRIGENEEGKEWEASFRIRARAEMTLREEAAKRRVIDIKSRNEMVLQYIENLVPLLRSILTNVGWRGEYFLAPRETGDPLKSHRQELAEIRNRYVPNFMTMFALASSRLDEMESFIDFFASIDPDCNELGIDANKANEVFKVLADFHIERE